KPARLFRASDPGRPAGRGGPGHQSVCSEDEGHPAIGCNDIHRRPDQRVLLSKSVSSADLRYGAITGADPRPDHRWARHSPWARGRGVHSPSGRGGPDCSNPPSGAERAGNQGCRLRAHPDGNDLPEARWHLALARAQIPHRGQAMTRLVVEAVTKRFRGLTAVDAVSFSVEAGEIFAVIGPNGAGKTTLFSLIAGALAPDSGTITFAGERIDGLRPDQIALRGIGRTFQIVRPFPRMTVFDNLMVGSLLRTTDTSVARD